MLWFSGIVNVLRSWATASSNLVPWLLTMLILSTVMKHRESWDPYSYRWSSRILPNIYTATYKPNDEPRRSYFFKQIERQSLTIAALSGSSLSKFATARWSIVASRVGFAPERRSCCSWKMEGVRKQSCELKSTR